MKDVTRDLDEHRPSPPAGGGPQGRPQQLGNTLRPGDLDRQLGHRPEHADQIELLERVLALVLGGNPADQDDHRGMGDPGGGHAGE
jgi:hypothetical protein